MASGKRIKMNDENYEISKRIESIEERFRELGYDMRALVQSEVKKRWKIQPQAETQFGMMTALCVDTVDPWKMGRIRFYNPLFHKPETPIKALPWAFPVSPFGALDGEGASWVPPAGSTVCILFENGNRKAPYYIGGTWHRNRGPDGQHNWGYNIDEYYRIHEGHRKGYLVGKNDGSQVLPPWNTENYNGFDIDSIADFENDPDAQRKITTPNIYGEVTPQKHTIKRVDGDPKCNYRDKRLEILSSCGNLIILKDDPFHKSGSWAHPSCVNKSPRGACTDSSGNPIEQTDCVTPTEDSNLYFKHQNECRPYKGPGTPQNNKIDLPQTGIQILSLSGHSFGMSDAVEQPRGVPSWEKSIDPFDYGCTNKYTGKTWWISHGGHGIIQNDVEEESGLRGEDNGVQIFSANGNRITLNDHTVGQGDCTECPPNVAGNRRGVTIESTSKHIIEMIDEGNEQCSPCRKGDGQPVNKAKKAFIAIRSGYGLEMLFADSNSQQETQNQAIQIKAPQKDNKERGPHILRMQERAEGPGQVFLMAGGDYICFTYDQHMTIVGDKEKNPSSQLVFVTKDCYHDTTGFYFNVADTQAFFAKKVILLMAGQDCTPLNRQPGDPCVPCIAPVLCLAPNGGIMISDRVFVSTSPNAQCASIEQLLPFFQCSPFDNCS